MCTFKDEQTVMVCDVAIGHVRERLQETFGEAVHYTSVDGKGTLVQAASTVDSARFQAITREAIATAQDPSHAPAQSS
jgi:hypothetical protein